jgi:mannose-6-phosphate isomerase
MELWGPMLLGSASPAREGGFPLLVKFLDAREHLSVQVHPSPAYAAAHAGAHLKTECWYVLDAEPESVIFKGVRPGVGREEFERALRAGDGQGVVELLASVPAVVGDCHNLPSGTVHALGAGVLVAEVQTPSDTTFRVYDWAREYGRAGREVHIEEALECIDFRPAEAATRGSNGRTLIRLVTSEAYTVDELAPGSGHPCTPGACTVVVCVRGGAAIEAHGQEPVRLGTGETALIPAALPAIVRTEAESRALIVGLG